MIIIILLIRHIYYSFISETRYISKYKLYVGFYSEMKHSCCVLLTDVHLRLVVFILQYFSVLLC